MGRLTVTFGAPRRTITYPAAPENLSKLLGVDLSSAPDLAGTVKQDHWLAALLEGAGELAAEQLVTATFNVSAEIATAANLAPDLLQAHSFVAALDADAGAGVDLQQDHSLDLNVFALSRLTVDISSEVILGAAMAATGDLAGDVTSQAAGNPMQIGAAFWSGTGAQLSLTGLGFQPDLILFYERDGGSSDHAYIGDRVSTGPGFIWDATGDDATWLWFTIDDPDSVISYDADGFTIGSSSRINASGAAMAALCFKIGDQFEVIDKTNDGVSGQVIPHNLSTSPVWAFVKQSDEHAGEWLAPWVEGSEAASVFGGAKGAETEGLQARSASDVTLGNSAQWNQSSGNAPLYLFGSENVSGSFHTGTYTGTGGAGNAITGLGFQPSTVLIRSLDGAGLFLVIENLIPDTAYRLDTPGRDAAFTLDADGFTVDAGEVNRSGEAYRYFAWV